MDYLSMFETDPKVIAADISAQQFAYLRGETSVRPRGAYCRTVTKDGVLTDRGTAVLRESVRAGR